MSIVNRWKWGGRGTVWLVSGLAILASSLVHPGALRAQAPADSTVTGTVTDQSTHAALGYVNVALRARADSTLVARTITRKDGSFIFSHVPPGAYVVECSRIGLETFRSPAFVIDPANPRMTLQTIALQPAPFLTDKVVVSAERSLFNQYADRRVYNIDADLMAKSSSVSDLLQKIPSVQVDIDGNVTLRGSADVMVLINGKKSPLMGASRSDVLQQLPAATIERIEVITNPSAQFTPEGTSGIINIVTKKDAGAGINGDVTAHLGEAGRHNENVTVGYNPGKLNLFGSSSYRGDRRTRLGTDVRTLPSQSVVHGYREGSLVEQRPYVSMGTLGLTYRADPKNTLECSGNYFRRRPSRNALSTIVTRDGAGAILADYDRRETGFELERETGASGALEHEFPKKDHTVRVEGNFSDAPQTEAVHQVQHWRTPTQADPSADVVLRQAERLRHLSVDYSDPLNDDSKLEAGYALELQRDDIHSDADSLDVSQGMFVPNAAKTYRFRLDQTIHAVYGTYTRDLGKFSAIVGLRTEHAKVSADIVTGALPFSDTYSGLYPTLHLAYQTTAREQFQLNFSRRIRRPEGEALNPFPEYTDPYNLSSGNPRLKPESIESYELGYRLRRDHFTFMPTVYFRDRRNGFTQVTRALSDSTFLRTPVNLASDRSAGLEPVVTLSAGRTLQANLNGNVFYDQINASNLGYADKKSVVSWSGAFNVTVSPQASTLLELSSNYRSARLTPQGDSRPSFVLNAGARQNLLRDRISLTLAVTDLLKTQKQDTHLDVSGIQQRVTRRRDSQVTYFGVTYHYGRSGKKDKKEKEIQYEDQP